MFYKTSQINFLFLTKLCEYKHYDGYMQFFLEISFKKCENLKF